MLGECRLLEALGGEVEMEKIDRLYAVALGKRWKITCEEGRFAALDTRKGAETNAEHRGGRFKGNAFEQPDFAGNVGEEDVFHGT